MKTIKQQISEALLAALQPLKTSYGVEQVERVRSLSDTSPRDSAVLVVLGDEEVQAEDNLGYVLSLPVNLVCTRRANSSVFERLEQLKGDVQATVETDAQLGSLCLNLTYAGEVDITESDRPGFVLVYTLTYRRRRANPWAAY